MTREERHARREITQPKPKVKLVKQLSTREQRERKWRRDRKADRG